MFWLRRSGRRSRKRRGFTIIELLVVVACLAILAAILFPLFAHVRNAAYRAQCSNNLRQLGTAFYQYSLDWDGYWPSPGGLYPYVKQRGLRSVWCCPLLTEWHGQFPPRSYSMNSYLRTCRSTSNPGMVVADMEYPGCVNYLCGINVSAISESRATVLLFEGIPRTKEFEDAAYTEDRVFYVYRCANWTWVRGYPDNVNHTIDPGHPWHGRSNNYLYCDGHVVLRPPDRYTGRMVASYDEMYQWYVDKARFRRRFAAIAP